MKRTLTYVRKSGTVSFQTPRGETIEIPIFYGILKHPSVSQLPGLLNNPAAIRKYTCEALRIAAWPVLKEFPRSWLNICMSQAEIRSNRRRALEYLLS